MPLFDAALTGRLSLDRLQPWGEAGVGYLKEKAWGLSGTGEGLVSCSSRRGPQGFQDVRHDNRLSKRPGCSQVQEGQSGHQPL